MELREEETCRQDTSDPIEVILLKYVLFLLEFTALACLLYLKFNLKEKNLHERNSGIS
jgi:hypothetical protein